MTDCDVLKSASVCLYLGCVLLYLFHKDKPYKLPKEFAKSLNKAYKKKGVYNPFHNKCDTKEQEDLVTGLLGLSLRFVFWLTLDEFVAFTRMCTYAHHIS